ncbi:MAG: hypothetical protein MHMPM18_002139 [Marteilia pararefringens]
MVETTLIYRSSNLAKMRRFHSAMLGSTAITLLSIPALYSQILHRRRLRLKSISLPDDTLNAPDRDARHEMMPKIAAIMGVSLISASFISYYYLICRRLIHSIRFYASSDYYLRPIDFDCSKTT